MEARDLFEDAVRGAEPPSPRAAARRAAMQSVLLGAVDRRRRRRAALRIAPVAAVLLAVVAWIARREAPAHVRTPEAATPITTLVRDDQEIVARWTSGLASPVRVERVVDRPIRDDLRLDDVGLVHWLRDAGAGTGIVRHGRDVFVAGAATE